MQFLKGKASTLIRKVKAGEGEQEIIFLDDNTIKIALRLIKPMPGTATLTHRLEALSENETHYTCTFSAYARFPINLPSYLIGRSIIKRTKQKTLNNVKQILELKANVT
jgi:hypothetical protein